MIKKRILGFAFFVVSLLVFAPLSAMAQQGGIQISPLTYNFEIKAGESKQAKIIVTNLNEEVLQYVCEVEDFSGVSDEGAPDFSKTELREGVTSLADWVTFDSSSREGTIAAKQEREINFTINIPEGAEPGGHYAAVFAKQIKKNAEGETELGVASRVGTLMLVSVPGDVKQSAKVSEFTYPKFVWTGPVDFGMKIENTGSVHYDSTAKVEIDPLVGANAEVDMGTHTVLPQNSRTYEGTWQKKFPFGYYKLTASATAGTGELATDEGSIIAIPVLIAVPLILLVVGIILIAKYLKSHIKIVKK